MEKLSFIHLAQASTSDFFSFARFVSQSEAYCGPNNTLVPSDKREEFDAIWFEMEIINANALSEWEDEKKPPDWNKKWLINYEKDAIELTDALVALIVGRNF